jgi:two-component system chemotaxis response regulator CheY
MSVSMTAPILIVDDYNTMVRILRNLLRQMGFTQIDEASDPRAALNKLRARDYQLVISDWNMEPIGGAELIKFVRSVERCRHVPFMMLARAAEEAEAAARAGANTYLVKPVTAPMLRNKLTALLGAF